MSLDKGNDCPNPKHFTCHGCGGSFLSERPEEDAMSEWAANRPLAEAKAKELGLPAEEVDNLVRVCDDCYQQLARKGLVR